MKKKTLVKVAVGYMLYEAVAWGALGLYLKKHELLVADGVVVYKVPNCITNAMGARIAATTYLGFKPIILVDDDFDAIAKRSTGVADFIIAHELGHLKLGHIKDRIKQLTKGKKPIRRVTQQEVDADTYAVTMYPHVTIYDGIKFVDMLKDGVEEHEVRKDNMYALYWEGNKNAEL